MRPRFTLALSGFSKAGLVFFVAWEYPGSVLQLAAFFFEEGGAAPYATFLSKIVGTASGLSIFRVLILNVVAIRLVSAQQSSVKWSLQRYEVVVGPLQSACVLHTCLVQHSLGVGSRGNVKKLIFSL